MNSGWERNAQSVDRDACSRAQLKFQIGAVATMNLDKGKIGTEKSNVQTIGVIQTFRMYPYVFPDFLHDFGVPVYITLRVFPVTTLVEEGIPSIRSLLQWHLD
jgi:hypothetical protein